MGSVEIHVQDSLSQHQDDRYDDGRTGIEQHVRSPVGMQFLDADALISSGKHQVSGDDDQGNENVGHVFGDRRRNDEKRIQQTVEEHVDEYRRLDAAVAE